MINLLENLNTHVSESKVYPPLRQLKWGKSRPPTGRPCDATRLQQFSGGCDNMATADGVLFRIDPFLTKNFRIWNLSHPEP